MSVNREQQVQALEGAFNVFNEVSARLATAYQELEQRVAGLTEELAQAHSERFRQLAEKERLANRLERLLAALPGAVVVLDGAGFVQECNPAAQRLFGAHALGRRWSDVSREVCDGEFASGSEIKLRSGTVVTVSINPLGAEPGQILLFQDVTETRALQASVDRHQRLSAMGEMVASLAHQLRTPLASALLYASNLQHNVGSEVERRRFAERTVARLRHLEQMVNDMLVFAKGGTVGAETLNVAALVEELRQLVEPAVVEAGACFAVAGDMPEVAIAGSRVALLGVFQNLINNALQAGGRGAVVALHAIERDGEMIFIVQDNGPGMSEAVRERVFEPFFTTRSTGTGLGLAIARSVVLAHRGQITLESMPGAGTRVVVRMPVAEKAQYLASGTSHQMQRSATVQGVRMNADLQR